MSSSTILSKQLETESAELKEYISKFFDEKAKEFASSMKEKMDQFVDQKLTRYYLRHQHEPFKTFSIGIASAKWDSAMGGQTTITFSIKSYCIKFMHPNGQMGSTSKEITHNLTPAMLDVVRCVFGGYIRSSDDIKCVILRIVDHPEYFMTDSTEFETTCREEYALIEKKKQDLDELLEEQQEKKDYYAELEERIKKVETKEKEIDLERQKLAEERAYLLEIKRKLVGMMKDKLEEEKASLEKQKALIEKVNLDDFVELDHYLEPKWE